MLYQKYVSARPIKNPKCSADFYLRPLAKFNNDGVGYSCQPLGIHKIESAIKKLCLEAGLKGKRSNHSLRAMAATRLYEGEVDEQLIQERTGHWSNAVRGYKRTSTNMQKKVCDTLYGSKTVTQPNKPMLVPHNVDEEPYLPSSPPCSEENVRPSRTPLHDSPEGQSLHRKLTAANMTL